jgi:hypothetical protein
MDVNLLTILWGCTGDILYGPLHPLYLTKTLTTPPPVPTDKTIELDKSIPFFRDPSKSIHLRN